MNMDWINRGERWVICNFKVVGIENLDLLLMLYTYRYHKM